MGAGDGSTYKWLGSQGNAYTDIAPGVEMPVGIVTLGKDQSIVVSLSCEGPSDCFIIEADLKTANSSEKLVVKEAGGHYGGLTEERSIEESGRKAARHETSGRLREKSRPYTMSER